MPHGLTEELLMPAVYVRHLVREFSDTSALLNGIDLDLGQIESPGRHITVGQNLRCVANAIALADSPDWYLPWGLSIAEYIHGPLTPALLSAPSLGDGLDAFLTYFSLRIPYMGFRSHHGDGQFEIELSPRMELGNLLPLLIEVPLLILQHYIGTIRNTKMEGARIQLGYPAPVWHASYQRWFECEVKFDCDRHGLALPSSWRQIANLGYDESLWCASLRKCDELAGPQMPTSTLGRVRNALHAVFEETAPMLDPPTLEGIAHRLHMSPRTLIRRLRAEGTTFQVEIDNIRQRRATALLSDTAMPIGEIARALAYSDPASFGKAFKRWHGISPSQFRNARSKPANVETSELHRSGI